MGFLSNLFGNDDPILKLACTGKAEEFSKVFLDSLSFFLYLPLPLSEAINAKKLGEKALLAQIEKAAKLLGAVTNIDPFFEDLNGKKILPLFTKEKHAEPYVGEFCKKMDMVIPFGVLGVEGHGLLHAISNADEVVFNMNSPKEIKLSSDIIKVLLNS